MLIQVGHLKTFPKKSAPLDLYWMLWQGPLIHWNNLGVWGQMRHMCVWAVSDIPLNAVWRLLVLLTKWMNPAATKQTTSRTSGPGFWARTGSGLGLWVHLTSTLHTHTTAACSLQETGYGRQHADSHRRPNRRGKSVYLQKHCLEYGVQFEYGVLTEYILRVEERWRHQWILGPTSRTGMNTKVCVYSDAWNVFRAIWMVLVIHFYSYFY